MSADRRAYHRDRARRKRARALAAQMAGATRCPAKLSRWTTCNAPLEWRIDHLGASRLVCPKCERKRQGICRDCPARVDGQRGKALRCARCRDRVIRASLHRYAARNTEAIRAKARAYAARPDVRERRITYKRAWRKANPEKVAQQKRRETLRQSPHRHRYHERYRAAHPASVARGHRCVTCPAPLTGRQKKCEACKRRDRAQAQQILQRGRAA